MSLLDLVIILIAVLFFLALHFPLAYVVIGTLLALIVVRLLVGERFVVRRPSS